MSQTASNTKELKGSSPDRSTSLNLIGRRIFEEDGVWPTYSRLKSWAYDGLYPTIRVGTKSAVAEADWPEAKGKILALIKAI